MVCNPQFGRISITSILGSSSSYPKYYKIHKVYLRKIVLLDFQILKELLEDLLNIYIILVILPIKPNLA